MWLELPAEHPPLSFRCRRQLVVMESVHAGKFVCEYCGEVRLHHSTRGEDLAAQAWQRVAVLGCVSQEGSQTATPLHMSLAHPPPRTLR